MQWKPASTFTGHRINSFALGGVGRPSLFNKVSEPSDSPPHRKIPFPSLPRMFEAHCPDHETRCVQHVVRRQKQMGEKAQNSERDEGEEIMLRISEIEGDFLAEMISNDIQFRILDRPFARPRLNPFLLVRFLPRVTMGCGLLY